MHMAVHSHIGIIHNGHPVVNEHLCMCFKIHGMATILSRIVRGSNV